MPVEVVLQERDDVRREGDLADAGVGLRRTDDLRTVDADDGAADVDDGRVEVEVTAAQLEDLTEAPHAPRGDEDGGAQPVRGLEDEQLELADGEGFDDALVRGGTGAAGAERVVADAALLDPWANRERSSAEALAPLICGVGSM